MGTARVHIISIEKIMLSKAVQDQWLKPFFQALPRMFLAFVAGGLVVLSQVWPYPIFRNAYYGGFALWQQWQHSDDSYHPNLWKKARSDAKGVTIYRPDAAAPGYTLYTSYDQAAARLVDMQGRIVHEWRTPYSEVWTESAAVSDPQPDRFVPMRRVKVLPNGDLLAIYYGANDTPFGYGLVKLNDEAEVIWSYLEHVHHDFDVAPGGGIVTLTHEVNTDSDHGFDFFSDPYLEDQLVVLTPAGEEKRKISLVKILADSRYSEAVVYATPHFALSDPLHANSVQWLSTEKAAALGVGKAGDILVNFRQINLMAVIDPREVAVEWATRGPWLAPHSPKILPDGDILLFDNRGDYVAGNRSRVFAFDPQSMAISWSYTGNREHPLDSAKRGAVQRLKNGNTLITEAHRGTLLEVTPAGEIVWEYVNPVRGGKNDRYVPIVTSGKRYSPGYFRPAFRAELQPENQEGL